MRLGTGRSTLGLMIRILALAAYTWFGTAGCSGFAAPQTTEKIDSARDEATIRSIVDHWRHAWQAFDASVLEGDYADDADWLNAFGVRKRGAAEIVAFASQVVKQPNVQGRQTNWGEIHVRFLRPTWRSPFVITKQPGTTRDGRELPERRTHANWLLTKEGGKWRIASHVISDKL